MTVGVLEWGRQIWLASHDSDCESWLAFYSSTSTVQLIVQLYVLEWPGESPWAAAFGGNGLCVCFLILRNVAYIYPIHPLHDFLWRNFADMMTLHALCFYIHQQISHLYLDVYIVVCVCTILWFALTTRTLTFALSQLAGGHVDLVAIYYIHITLNTKPPTPTIKPWVLDKFIFSSS